MSDSGDKERISCCHVVAMPHPGRGHINPMLNLCKFLASKADDIVITVVVTEEWFGFIGSEPKPPNLRFRTVPNVIPSELVRGDDIPAFVEAVFTKLEAPFEKLLDSMELPVTAIIADTFLGWTVSVGNRRNIPVVSLWTMSPSIFTMFYHFDLLVQNRHFPVDLSEHGNDVINYIPGISAVRLADLPPFSPGPGLDQVMDGFSWALRSSRCIVLSSFYELETQVTDTLRATLPFSVYSVGPLIPHTTLKDTPHTAITSHHDMDYLKWLDNQPRGSVLYISMGSFVPVSSDQMDEIIAGVHASGVRYLRVARGDALSMQDGCGGMGLVVPWCDQLRVLCHSSIGGFLTHCGWNSTLEGAFSGVPMLAFPLIFDQFPNRRLIVDVWKVGVNVKVEKETMVKREEIAKIVQSFMDLDRNESKEMRRRAGELKEICRLALAKGGSSASNLDALVKELLTYRC